MEVAMKIRFHSGEFVAKGSYWNISTGELIRCETDGTRLAGKGETYLRAHPALILLAGPPLGLLYAMFLPLIGVLMVLKVLGSKLLAPVGHALASEAGFRWRPSEAYLSGKKKAGKNKKEVKAS
jgi:hypothetical protein